MISSGAHQRIFDRVALTNLDDTDIARVDLGLGVIVVLEDSLSLENVVRLGVFHMLVELMLAWAGMITWAYMDACPMSSSLFKI